MLDLYDIKRKTLTWSGGVPVETWAVRDVRKIDVRPLRGEPLEIEMGGEKYTPQYRGFMRYQSSATAADRVTADSGTTDF
jgi:hypothetical protein